MPDGQIGPISAEVRVDNLPVDGLVGVDMNPMISTPDQILGSAVVCWLRAASLQLNDGDSVSLWSDLSGNGNDAAQATAANQPLFKKDILNGMPVVRFAGNAGRQFMNTVANSYQVMTIIIIASKTDSTFVDYPGVVVVRSSPTKGAASNENNGWSGVYAHNGVSSLPAAATQFSVDGSDYSIGGATGSINDGFQAGQDLGDEFAAHITCYQQPSVLGTKVWCIGADSFGAIGSRHWNGDVAEIILVNRAITTGERYQVEAYGSNEYNIPVVVG